MREHFLKACCVMLPILSFTAKAELVTYEISATVYDVYDSGNILQGEISPGNTISGTYTFELSVADDDPSPEYARYDQTHTNASGFELSVNNNTIKSDKTVPGHMQEMFIGDSQSDHFNIISWGNTALNNGATITDIIIDLHDPNGTVLNNTALSATPPNLSAFSITDLSLYGSNSTGNYFNVIAKIDNMRNLSQGSGNPEIVTFNVMASVKDVWDPANALNGNVNIGSIVEGTYTFNLTTPDSEPAPDIGRYHHSPGSGQYGLDLVTGGLSFKMDPDNVELVIDMYNGNPSPDHYTVFSYGRNFPLPNGATVEDIGLNLSDDTGALLSSTELSNTPPVIPNSNYNEIYIWGRHPNGIDTYSIVAQLQEIGATGNTSPGLVALSPSTGIFDRAQRFDLAIIFQANLPLMMDMLVTINGFDESHSLFDCIPGAPNSQNRLTFVCPDYSNRVGPVLQRGINRLDFQFILEDGTTLNESVEWEMLDF